MVILTCNIFIAKTDVDSCSSEWCINVSVSFALCCARSERLKNKIYIYKESDIILANQTKKWSIILGHQFILVLKVSLHWQNYEMYNCKNHLELLLICVSIVIVVSYILYIGHTMDMALVSMLLDLSILLIGMFKLTWAEEDKM